MRKALYIQVRRKQLQIGGGGGGAHIKQLQIGGGAHIFFFKMTDLCNGPILSSFAILLLYIFM